MCTAWDSSFLDNIDKRLQAVESSLNYFADRLVYDEPPAESVAGGLKNITNIGVYNYTKEKYLHDTLLVYATISISYPIEAEGSLVLRPIPGIQILHSENLGMGLGTKLHNEHYADLIVIYSIHIMDCSISHTNV